MPLLINWLLLTKTSIKALVFILKAIFFVLSNFIKSFCKLKTLLERIVLKTLEIALKSIETHLLLIIGYFVQATAKQYFLLTSNT